MPHDTNGHAPPAAHTCIIMCLTEASIVCRSSSRWIRSRSRPRHPLQPNRLSLVWRRDMCCGGCSWMGVPRSSSSYVCLICLPYMSALYVLLDGRASVLGLLQSLPPPCPLLPPSPPLPHLSPSLPLALSLCVRVCHCMCTCFAARTHARARALACTHTRGR